MIHFQISKNLKKFQHASSMTTTLFTTTEKSIVSEKNNRKNTISISMINKSDGNVMMIR